MTKIEKASTVAKDTAIVESLREKMVDPSSTFIKNWQKENGGFLGFKDTRCVLCISKMLDGKSALWKSAKGNMMVCIQDIELGNKYNLPAGIFLGYLDEHPDTNLVESDGETWTISRDVPFSYDPVEGITED